MVTSWILNSVSVDIRNSVVYMRSARDIWLDLEIRYSQSNVPKLFNLRSEISNLSQGNLSITTYFTKFRSVYDELECISSKTRCDCTNCTCNVNAKLDAHDQDVQLSHFLMGLNDQFTAVRGQILLMKPLPSLSQCYAILLQEENQRTMQLSAINNESVAMSVKSSGQSKFQYAKGKKQNSDIELKCDYCHLTGHTREKCYSLHGYPSWHKLFGKPKPKPRFQNSNTRNSTAAQVSIAKLAITDYNIYNMTFSEIPIKAQLSDFNKTASFPDYKRDVLSVVLDKKVMIMPFLEDSFETSNSCNGTP